MSLYSLSISFGNFLFMMKTCWYPDRNVIDLLPVFSLDIFFHGILHLNGGGGGDEVDVEDLYCRVTTVASKCCSGVVCTIVL